MTGELRSLGQVEASPAERASSGTTVGLKADSQIVEEVMPLVFLRRR
jgi:hypothetical protein